MKGTVKHLYHYPIKGLSPQPLNRVPVSPGEGFPFDRVFGLARADSGFDAAAPRPLPKNRFFMLMKDERLAALRTFLDTGTQEFTIHRDGELLLECNLSTSSGAEAAVSFFSALFKLPENRRPVLAHAVPHRFTDVSVTSSTLMNAVSLINVASVAEFGERIGKNVDPMRFRGNIFFDGWPPFSELDLVDREIKIGEMRLRILKRTQRCPATEVNPATADRDIPVPRLLLECYGHADMGVYAEILSKGTIAGGDVISL